MDDFDTRGGQSLRNQPNNAQVSGVSLRTTKPTWKKTGPNGVSAKHENINKNRCVYLKIILFIYKNYYYHYDLL